MGATRGANGRDVYVARRSPVLLGVAIAAALTPAPAVAAEAPAAAGTTISVACDDAGYSPGDVQDAVAAFYDTILIAGTCTENLVIDRSLDVLGTGPASTTISGGNAGAVVTILGGAVSISGVTITDGSSGGGGGIYNAQAHGSVTLSNVTVSGNSASWGGGIANYGTLSLINATVSGNHTTGGPGGGIGNELFGTVTLTDSTVSGNHASRGGGIFTGEGSVTLANSTVSGNTVAWEGGGLHNSVFGIMTRTNSTVSGNTAGRAGGGIYNWEDLTLANTVVATNHGPDPDCSGKAPTSEGYNLIGDATGCGGFTGLPSDQVGTGATPIDPAVGPLQDNGGATFTHALWATSPAINAIPAVSCFGLSDQRGIDRPGGAACDVGAYEAETATAVDDGYSTAHDTALPVAVPGVLGNDTDPEGDALAASLAGGPSHGTVFLDADGSFTYTPEVGFSGADVFTYRADDASGTSNVATVTVTVGASSLPQPSTVAPTVALYDPDSGMWHLRNSAEEVISFFYGNPGDIPIMGDWDCDGVDSPGLFRRSEAFIHLRNSNTRGIADVSYLFGNPSDVPLAGDFDGDGCDTVSLYRASEQRFYISNELGAQGLGLGDADFSFTFGGPGAMPLAGDWDGDGIDEVGLHQESTGLLSWRDTSTAGVASGEILFGNPGDLCIAGDWGIADGIDTPAVFRPSAATFYFRHTLTPGVADSQFAFGDGAFLPVAWAPGG